MMIIKTNEDYFKDLDKPKDERKITTVEELVKSGQKISRESIKEINFGGNYGLRSKS